MLFRSVASLNLCDFMVGMLYAEQSWKEVVGEPCQVDLISTENHDQPQRSQFVLPNRPLCRNCKRLAAMAMIELVFGPGKNYQVLAILLQA